MVARITALFVMAVVVWARTFTDRFVARREGAGVRMVDAAPKHHVQGHRKQHHILKDAVHQRSGTEDLTHTHPPLSHPRLRSDSPLFAGGWGRLRIAWTA